MPHVSNQGQVNRSSQRNQTDLKKVIPHAIPRDNLSGSFAGHENNGPSRKGTKSTAHSTNVKSRASKASKFKTPKR